MSSTSQQILVTGGAGFISPHLCKARFEEHSLDLLDDCSLLDDSPGNPLIQWFPRYVDGVTETTPAP